MLVLKSVVQFFIVATIMFSCLFIVDIASDFISGFIYGYSGKFISSNAVEWCIITPFLVYFIYLDNKKRARKL